MEAQERDRLANFSAKALASGLNERPVKIEEQRGQMMAAMVVNALAEANVAPEVATAIKAAIARQLREAD